MEGEGAETGKSFFGKLKDGVRSRISSAPKTAETETKEEPKSPKVSVKSPKPSRTLGAKPPAWLEQQHKEIEEAREKTERKELEAVAQVPQVPAPEYASEFPESSTEGQQETVGRIKTREEQKKAA